MMDFDDDALDFLGADFIGAEWTTAPSLEAVRAGNGVIKKGMRGPAVSYVQQKAGLKGSAVDGAFGDGTDAAVRAFQKGMELDDDGIVGKDTLEALDGVYIVNETAPPIPGKPAAEPSPGTPEKKSDLTWLALLLGAVGVAGIAYGVSE